jgi:hypothetical protein
MTRRTSSSRKGATFTSSKIDMFDRALPKPPEEQKVGTRTVTTVTFLAEFEIRPAQNGDRVSELR